MRRITGLALAVGIIVAAVAGCGISSRENMAHRLKTEANALDSTNYESKAMMTVQMDNSSQTYYIETAYDSSSVYRIKLGDANKHINQIIVHNQNGMFIVSPSLQKVFRFNGNWAQNQGHIYLYDQILQQLAMSKDLKTQKSAGGYTFEIPTTSGSDVVVKERVLLDKNLDPKQVILFDQAGKAVVTIDFKQFTTNVKYTNADFDPHQLIGRNPAAKTALAPGMADIGIVMPAQYLGDTLQVDVPVQTGGHLLRYEGPHNFVLEETAPTAQDLGFQDASMIDLFGVPAVFTSIAGDKELVWMNNGVQYSLISNQLDVNQLQNVAISTIGQVGK